MFSQVLFNQILTQWVFFTKGSQADRALNFFIKQQLLKAVQKQKDLIRISFLYKEIKIFFKLKTN